LEIRMIRSLLLVLAVPLGSLAAQASAVHLTVTSPNQAAFRISPLGVDSLHRPLIARGRVDLMTGSSTALAAGAQEMEITALDTTSAIHIEASQNGRVIASGEGVYLHVRRDTIGISIEARSSVPAAIARTLRRPE
jgi:hypothetical protein